MSKDLTLPEALHHLRNFSDLTAVDKLIAVEQAANILENCEEVLQDHRALVRQLDVALNGAGAAQQASLCDIVKQVEREGIKASDYTVHQHPDDAAVDRFAAAMKARMAEMRAKGKSGWDDPSVCSVDYLARLLQHCTCSEPVDIGNYAMMIFNRTQT